MPGNDVDELIAWSMPASTAEAIGLGELADHTYVTSASGLAWGCCGRFEGGRRLSSDSGSSKMADCLAQLDGKAGIRYLRTGVCHQISNRILWPSGVTVDGASGYENSIIYYGFYGKRVTDNSWPEKDFCEGIPDLNTEFSRLSPAPWREDDVTNDENTSNEIDDFCQTLRRKLKQDVSEKEISELAAIQRLASARKSELFRDLDEASVSPGEFLITFKNSIRDHATLFENVLGQERYRRFFGGSPEMSASFVDDGMFFRDQQGNQTNEI